jgi:regulator of protease activity HflC (stomatin/prohibitin superfamily)
MEKETITILGVIIIIILILFYLLISMDVVEPLEYGLPYNKFTKNIGKEAYDNGRYILNPFKSFLKYPKNLVTIEFSQNKIAESTPLQTRTGEGLAVILSVSFQYQLIKEKIPDLYNLANINFHSTYVRISRDVILKVGGMFNATDYWMNRVEIAEIMKQTMDNELLKAYGHCISLQLLKIELPKTYEDSIVQTQVEIQKINMRKFEQSAELIRQNSLVIISEAEQKIRVTNATGLAEASRIKAFAKANALNNTVNAENMMYKMAMDELGLTPDQLMNYIYLDSIMNQNKAKLLFDVNSFILNYGK